jgi:hypothetical protein
MPLSSPIAMQSAAPATCWRGAGDTWEIYPDTDGWHWRRSTPEGRVAGESVTGHPRRRECFADALANGMTCAPM